MTDNTTVLVPIRYPLNEESARTLAAAGQLAQQHSPADLLVLHVNLFQTNENIQTEELTRAISSVLDDVNANVITRRGFFVEETILEETEELDADFVVVGVDQTTIWRRLIRRVLGNVPAISSYLRANETTGVEVVEVDMETKIPTVVS